MCPLNVDSLCVPDRPLVPRLELYPARSFMRLNCATNAGKQVQIKPIPASAFLFLVSLHSAPQRQNA
jgi:hypothetical protein